MTAELSLLLAAAVSIGFFHTLTGPDHYLPFIVMARSGRWSMGRTALVTLLCGIGHVLGSVLLGTVGILFGIAVGRLEGFESFRGSLAAWFMMAFGLVYLLWGVRQAFRNKPHRHFHPHPDGTVHDHRHTHKGNHIHVHEEEGRGKTTAWILFIIFVFGPCEPLIPLLMYPAARGSIGSLIAVTGAFSLVTICTMLGMVMISVFGIRRIRVSGMERYSHALAGAAVLLCGVSIQFLGL